MKRRSLTDTLSTDVLALNDAWRWYEFQRTLIGNEKSRVNFLLRSGLELDDPRYSEIQIDGADAFFEFQITELVKCSTLVILASAEAVLNIDFISRIQKRKKGCALTRAFAKAHKMRGNAIRKLDEDILDNLRLHAGNKELTDAISAFKGARRLRHWLAHGRHWKPKPEHKHIFDYHITDVFDICKNLIDRVAELP